MLDGLAHLVLPCDGSGGCFQGCHLAITPFLRQWREEWSSFLAPLLWVIFRGGWAGWWPRMRIRQSLLFALPSDGVQCPLGSLAEWRHRSILCFAKVLLHSKSRRWNWNRVTGSVCVVGIDREMATIQQTIVFVLWWWFKPQKLVN